MSTSGEEAPKCSREAKKQSMTQSLSGSTNDQSRPPSVVSGSVKLDEKNGRSTSGSVSSLTISDRGSVVDVNKRKGSNGDDNRSGNHRRPASATSSTRSRPISARSSSSRPTSSKSRSRMSYESDFDEGSVSRVSIDGGNGNNVGEGVGTENDDSASVISGVTRPKTGHAAGAKSRKPRKPRKPRRPRKTAGDDDVDDDEDDLDDDDIYEDEDVDSSEDELEGDFSHFVVALRAETENLAARFRDGPDSLDPNDSRLETASLRGLLQDLTISLRKSETRSSEICGSIGEVQEATKELKKILAEKLNCSSEAEKKEEQDGNKKPSSEAAVAAAESRAALARLTAEVAEAKRMAAEAESAAAEARAKATEASEEIVAANASVKEIEEENKEQTDGGTDKEGLEKEEEAVEEKEVDDDEDEMDRLDEEYEQMDEEKDDSNAVEEKEAEVDEVEEPKEKGQDEDEGGQAEERTTEVEDGREEEEEEKKDSPKPVLSPKLSIKENLLEWPHHILPVTINSEEEVGCVVRFKDEYFPAPASLHLVCCYDNELSTNVVDDSEEMVSNVVRLRHEDDDDDNAEGDDLGAPIVVAIPYTVSGRMASTREFVVKMRGREDEEWQIVPTLALEGAFAEHKGVFAEVKTSRLGSFAVVAKLARDKQTITKKGGTVKSSADHRVTISYPVGACSLISVSLQVQPAENVVSEIKARLRHCAELITASPIVHMTHSSKKPFEKPITITIPCPPNPHKSSDSSGSSSEGGGVTGGVGGGGSGGGKRGEKDKAQSNMEPLRPEGVVVIRATKSSIFGGDPSQDALYVLGRQGSSAQWNEMEDVPIKQVKKDVVAVDIQEPMDKLVILRVAQDARFPIKCIAGTFERALQIRYAKLIFFHKEDEPHKAVVACVPTKQMDNAMRKLNNEGYFGPPDPSDEIPVTEGQEITLRFSGNVRMVGKDELKLNYHSHRRTYHYIKLREVNRFGNHSSPEYRGCAEFYGTARVTLEDIEDPEETMLREAEAKAKEKKTEKENKPISLKEEKKIKDTKAADQSAFFKKAPDLLSKLHVSLPKPDPDQPLPPSRYRTTAIDAGGIVCNANLRWLSNELGNEWESLGAYLGLRKSRLQSIKRNNPDSQDQQIFDMLVTWRSMLPKAYNKERKICSALTRCGRYDLAEELRYRDQDVDNEYVDEQFEDE
ncbi:uncharacterized protein [Diadema antillarum]|uniref:uncharacterized protein n=1 Tax=Diadema antillarum TaxID=105358 RepID=UPI003A8C19A2